MHMRIIRAVQAALFVVAVTLAGVLGHAWRPDRLGEVLIAALEVGVALGLAPLLIAGIVRTAINNELAEHRRIIAEWVEDRFGDQAQLVAEALHTAATDAASEELLRSRLTREDSADTSEIRRLRTAGGH